MKKFSFILVTFIFLSNCSNDSAQETIPVVESTTLSLSSENLALSVSGITEYGVSGTPSSGVPRVLTLTNSGTLTATNLIVSSPTWPSGTSHTTTCGATLEAGATCSVTITPGAVASSDGSSPCSSGTAPVASTLSFSADNASTQNANIYVLSYGCIYQGGYVFALDDTPSNTSSVSGKVLSTTDQAAPYPNGIIWSSNGLGGEFVNSVFDIIYGISETSTTSSPTPASGQVTGQTACNGNIDGTCNTNNIYVYYQNFALNAPISTSFYAAGLCKQTIASYSDWYLPAICEMGFDSGGAATGCGTSGTPTLQNAQGSLVDFNGLNILSGDYYSSTVLQAVPDLAANYQLFANGGGSSQLSTNKGNELGVRCARIF